MLLGVRSGTFTMRGTTVGMLVVAAWRCRRLWRRVALRQPAAAARTRQPDRLHQRPAGLGLAGLGRRRPGRVHRHQPGEQRRVAERAARGRHGCPAARRHRPDQPPGDRPGDGQPQLARRLHRRHSPSASTEASAATPVGIQAAVLHVGQPPRPTRAATLLPALSAAGSIAHRHCADTCMRASNYYRCARAPALRRPTRRLAADLYALVVYLHKNCNADLFEAVGALELSLTPDQAAAPPRGRDRTS